jgi:hypothetical protein
MTILATLSPEPTRPEWSDLPEPTRQRLVELLGQMLCGHREPGASPAPCAARAAEGVEGVAHE